MAISRANVAARITRGNIYLDEENHTAVCIRNDDMADLLGEFSISEIGGIDGERRRRLGANYDVVQRRVNEILGAAGTISTSIDVDAMARTVVRGDHGNGGERRRRLGSYYSIVQARVNEMLS